MPAGKLSLVAKATKPHFDKKKKIKRSVTVNLTKPRTYVNRLLSSKNKSPFGQSHTSNFRYVQQISISPGVTASAHSFRINSMYDPDFTGTGHQPLFRDVMSGIYARYRVNSVKYKITCMQGNANQLLVGVFATQDTGYNPNLDQFQNIIEKRNTDWRFQNVNTPPVVLKGRLTCAKVAGVTRQAYKDERSYSGAVGADPALPLFLTIFCQELLSGSPGVQFMVELEFNTTYYEPVVQPQN